MGFYKTFMNVKFVNHRPMLKLLPQLVTSHCSVMACSTLLTCFVKIFSQVSRNIGSTNVRQVSGYAVKITR
jgi:hypothetical protein